MSDKIPYIAKDEPETEPFGWPGAFAVVACLALICATLCFVVWVIWG